MALMQENKDDPSFVADTENKVQNLTDYYCSIEDKIKEKINIVNMALFRCQDFDEALAYFEGWLSEAEGKQKSLGQLSIKPTVIKRQRVLLKVRGGPEWWRKPSFYYKITKREFYLKTMPILFAQFNLGDLI